jgi:hypothetical protein
MGTDPNSMEGLARWLSLESLHRKPSRKMRGPGIREGKTFEESLTD